MGAVGAVGGVVAVAVGVAVGVGVRVGGIGIGGGDIGGRSDRSRGRRRTMVRMMRRKRIMPSTPTTISSLS